MAEVVQVEALAGHVGAQQDADGVVQAAEAVHQFLLFGVGHLAMQHGQLVGLHLQVGSELLLQPAQGFNAFGEDDQAVCGVVGFPAEFGRAQVSQQALVFAEADGGGVCGQRTQTVGQFFQAAYFSVFFLRGAGLVG